MTTFVTMLADSKQSAIAQNNDSTPISAQDTQLELPEIGYQSQVLSQAAVYTESVPVAESTVENSTPDISIASSNNTTTQMKEVASDNNVSDAIVSDTKTEAVSQLTVATIAVPSDDTLKTTTVEKPAIAVNQPEPEQALVSDTASDIHHKTIVVQKNDTLSAIFKRHSLSSNTLYKIINSGAQAKKLTRIKPGQTFTLTLNNDQIQSLKFNFNRTETLIVDKEADKFVSRIEAKEVDIVQQFASATINNSLFSAGQKAGLDSAMIMKLAHIFGWDIDFALDIRKGDSFSVLFEEKHIEGKKIGNGNILSAEFSNNGKLFKAIRYTDASGHTDYYSEDGLSMRKAFLRSPVEFSRISSRFSSGRKHPVLNRIRAHKGVDYAASRGTPIKAVGDGKVAFKGNKGGYGRVIILQHGSKYTTLYAHLNSYNKKLRNGSRVKQGETIGYVGSSGLATGPHLHYEFRVSGVHRNPLTVSLPSAAPIAKKYRTDFNAAAETMISQLKLRKQETVALKEE